MVAPVISFLIVILLFFAHRIVIQATPLLHSHVHHHSPSAPRTNGSDLYHSTDQLLSLIRDISARCPHADAEWTVVTSITSGRWRFPLFANLPVMLRQTSKTQRDKLLTVTVTQDAKNRNAARRAGGIVTPRRAVVATFGEHGRELITSELALRILQRLCSESPSDEEDALLKRTELLIIPLVNEQGRRAVEAGNNCSRLNSRDVDLNRNYRRGWGLSDNTTVRAEERSGRAPLSEYEARAVDAIVRRFSPWAYISIHSGEVAVLPPWDGHGKDETINPWVRLAASNIAAAHCGECVVGRASHAFGYKAFGTGVDHMHSERKVPLALTVEVYGGNEAHCSTMFNPQTSAQFEAVMKNWSSLLHTVARIVDAHEIETKPVVSTSVGQGQPGHASFLRDYMHIPETSSDDEYQVHWEMDDGSQLTERQKQLAAAGRPQGQVRSLIHGDSGERNSRSLQRDLLAMTLFAVALPVANALHNTVLGDKLIEISKRWVLSANSSRAAVDDHTSSSTSSIRSTSRKRRKSSSGTV